jgi:hypothetical protein
MEFAADCAGDLGITFGERCRKEAGMRRVAAPGGCGGHAVLSSN